ncbi:MAG: hypothetical protein ISQ34_00065 [Rickettsiales bacterium]|nr:hypothetical protein [Rickettsiales bacterium]
MKSLIIINEDFFEMHLGQNTSLFYIVDALKKQHSVYIWNLDEQFLTKRESEISCYVLEKNSHNAQKLVEQYEKFNAHIIHLIENEDFNSLLNVKTPNVATLALKIDKKEVKLAEFDNIIQRLEPMKAPFPPQGDCNIDDYLRQLKTLFPHKKIHLPIGLNDKLLPLKLNTLLKYEIATPTFVTRLNDKNIKEKINLAIKKYQHIYQSDDKKLVIKPIDSAQSLGVFAMEFRANGYDLEEILQKTTHELNEAQIFHINDDLLGDVLRKTLHILCYAQVIDSNQKLSQISLDEISNEAKKLYKDYILIQPFIEGVRQGDIRANIMKNDNNEFYLAGYVYRKSIQKDDNFTTCYSGGKAISLPIKYLTQAEQENVKEHTKHILNALNNDLKHEYKDVLELGFDFLIVGDDKNILLGEINHHCPALLPISQNLNY